MSTDSNVFQRILQAKRTELSAATANRDEIRIENAAEDVDRIQQRMNREIAIRNLDRESRLLKSVEEALERIEIGSFGMCVRCDQEIPEKRLKAVPWASYCLSCQEDFERRRATDSSEEDGDILNAA